MKNEKIGVVLVTYNRLDLLKGSIQSILNQSLAVDKVFVINNNSTDGTKKYLEDLSKDRENIIVENLSENVGGAGGFNAGLKLAHKLGTFDYYWLMDDDTFPTSDALEKLMEKSNEINDSIGFLSSNVVWKDDTPSVMNVPTVSDVWNDRISENIVRLQSGSFVSMLISNEAVEKCGLPISQFFIWGDDVEYSSRISKYFPSYFVIDSKVIHKTKSNNGINIFNESKDRVGRYFYDTRNNMYRFRKQSKKKALKFAFGRLFLIAKIMSNSECKYKIKKSSVIAKGIFSGMFFNPTIEYV